MSIENDPLTTALREEIVAEHQRLDELLRDLELASDTSRLPLLLDGLYALLRGHFAREEATDGLYDLLEVRTGAVSEHARGLREEHATLLADVDTLRRDCLTEPEPGVLRPRIAEACEKLRLHEHRESLMMINALSHGSDDAGQAD